MPEKRPFLTAIRLQNLLSFGAEPVVLELRPLNILIGPNGSGKSNLIEAIDLMRLTPIDLPDGIRKKGGVLQFLWKGEVDPTAEIELGISINDGATEVHSTIYHQICFAEQKERFYLKGEVIESRDVPDGQARTYYQNINDHPELRTYTGNEPSRESIDITDKSWAPNQSILKQRRDPNRYPQLTHIADEYGVIRIYRDLNVGKDSNARSMQDAGYSSDFLDEDLYNLALMVNHLENSPGWARLLDYLRKFYDPLERITTKIENGKVQIYLHERGMGRLIPVTRFSDGFLRFLCLLTILCHPEPPSLICIEEPELGMHPDSLPLLAELFKEASERTQLIVTTHSDVLVDALSDEPENVVICEKEYGASTFKRLDRQALSEWLQKYALGELWRMGEIGGTRW